MKYLKKYNESTNNSIVEEVEDILNDIKDDGLEVFISDKEHHASTKKPDYHRLNVFINKDLKDIYTSTPTSKLSSYSFKYSDIQNI